MYSGRVIYYNRRRQYGLISESRSEAEVFFLKAACDKSYSPIYPGDNVLFKMIDEERGKTATEISFVHNENLDDLKKDFEKGITRNGFLKKVDNSFFVKDKSSYIIIPLIISSFEIKIEETYERQLNNPLEFRIVFFSNYRELRAINSRASYNDSFNQIMGQKKLKAEILKPSKGGWLVNVMGSKGFIPGSMAMTIKEHLIKGNTINVSCINFNYAFDSFVFAPE